MSKNYRFINRDGGLNVNRIGHRRAVFSDAYHGLIAMKWRYFIVWLVCLYFGINLLFALLFWLGGDCVEGASDWKFADAYFFSIQTLSTIGYGTLSPKTFYADCVVAVEAFVGMLFTAMSTGLVFSKFSRPTARIQFTRKAVVHGFNDVPTLMFRAANMRGNQIVDATISVSFARFEDTREGEQYRRFYELDMYRDRTAMFILTWTAMHAVDETSPLHGLTKEEWRESQAEIIIMIKGVDGTFGQTVHARHSYTIDDIEFDARFEDMLHVSEDGILNVDYTRFEQVVPVDEPGNVSDPASTKRAKDERESY